MLLQITIEVDSVTGVAAGILLQIILMIAFRFVETCVRFERRHHWITPALRLIYNINKGERFFFFLVICKEDHRAIRRPPVIALLIQCGGIMYLEEKIKNFLER